MSRSNRSKVPLPLLEKHAEDDWQPKTPPGYRSAIGSVAKCASCRYFRSVDNTCTEYQTSVDPNFVCLSWEGKSMNLGGQSLRVGDVSSIADALVKLSWPANQSWTDRNSYYAPPMDIRSIIGGAVSRLPRLRVAPSRFPLVPKLLHSLMSIYPKEYTPPAKSASDSLSLFRALPRVLQTEKVALTPSVVASLLPRVQQPGQQQPASQQPGPQQPGQQQPGPQQPGPQQPGQQQPGPQQPGQQPGQQQPGPQQPGQQQQQPGQQQPGPQQPGGAIPEAGKDQAKDLMLQLLLQSFFNAHHGLFGFGNSPMFLGGTGGGGGGSGSGGGGSGGGWSGGWAPGPVPGLGAVGYYPWLWQSGMVPFGMFPGGLPAKGISPEETAMYEKYNPWAKEPSFQRIYADRNRIFNQLAANKISQQYADRLLAANNDREVGLLLQKMQQTGKNIEFPAHLQDAVRRAQAAPLFARERFSTDNEALSAAMRLMIPHLAMAWAADPSVPRVVEGEFGEHFHSVLGGLDFLGSALRLGNSEAVRDPASFRQGFRPWQGQHSVETQRRLLRGSVDVPADLLFDLQNLDRDDPVVKSRLENPNLEWLNYLTPAQLQAVISAAPDRGNGNRTLSIADALKVVANDASIPEDQREQISKNLFRYYFRKFTPVGAAEISEETLDRLWDNFSPEYRKWLANPPQPFDWEKARAERERRERKWLDADWDAGPDYEDARLPGGLTQAQWNRQRGLPAPPRMSREEWERRDRQRRYDELQAPIDRAKAQLTERFGPGFDVGPTVARGAARLRAEGLDVGYPRQTSGLYPTSPAPTQPPAAIRSAVGFSAAAPPLPQVPAALRTATGVPGGSRVASTPPPARGGGRSDFSPQSVWNELFDLAYRRAAVSRADGNINPKQIASDWFGSVQDWARFGYEPLFGGANGQRSSGQPLYDIGSSIANFFARESGFSNDLNKVKFSRWRDEFIGDAVDRVAQAMRANPDYRQAVRNVIYENAMKPLDLSPPGDDVSDTKLLTEYWAPAVFRDNILEKVWDAYTPYMIALWQSRWRDPNFRNQAANWQRTNSPLANELRAVQLERQKQEAERRRQETLRRQAEIVGGWGSTVVNSVQDWMNRNRSMTARRSFQQDLERWRRAYPHVVGRDNSGWPKELLEHPLFTERDFRSRAQSVLTPEQIEHYEKVLKPRIEAELQQRADDFKKRFRDWQQSLPQNITQLSEWSRQQAEQARRRAEEEALMARRSLGLAADSFSQLISKVRDPRTYLGAFDRITDNQVGRFLELDPASRQRRRDAARQIRQGALAPLSGIGSMNSLSALSPFVAPQALAQQQAQQGALSALTGLASMNPLSAAASMAASKAFEQQRQQTQQQAQQGALSALTGLASMNPLSAAASMAASKAFEQQRQQTQQQAQQGALSALTGLASMNPLSAAASMAASKAFEQQRQQTQQQAQPGVAPAKPAVAPREATPNPATGNTGWFQGAINELRNRGMKPSPQPATPPAQKPEQKPLVEQFSAQSSRKPASSLGAPQMWNQMPKTVKASSVLPHYGAAILKRTPQLKSGVAKLLKAAESGSRFDVPFWKLPGIGLEYLGNQLGSLFGQSSDSGVSAPVRSVGPASVRSSSPSRGSWSKFLMRGPLNLLLPPFSVVPSLPGLMFGSGRSQKTQPVQPVQPTQPTRPDGLLFDEGFIRDLLGHLHRSRPQQPWVELPWKIDPQGRFPGLFGPPDGAPWGGAPWGGAPWGGAPWGGGPWGGGPWGGGPWGGGPWGGGPWGGGPWDRGPWDRGPWDRGPWDRGPWDRGPWDRGPWDRKPKIVGPPFADDEDEAPPFRTLPRKLGPLQIFPGPGNRIDAGGPAGPQSPAAPPQQQQQPTSPRQPIGGVGAAGQPLPGQNQVVGPGGGSGPQLLSPTPAGGVGATGQTSVPPRPGNQAGGSTNFRLAGPVPAFGVGLSSLKPFSPNPPSPPSLPSAGAGAKFNATPPAAIGTGLPKKSSVSLKKLLGLHKKAQGAPKNNQTPGSNFLPQLPPPPSTSGATRPFGPAGREGQPGSRPSGSLNLPPLPPPPPGSAGAVPGPGGSGRNPGPGVNSPLLPPLPAPPASLQVQPPAASREAGNFLPGNWANDPKLVFDIFTSQPTYVDDPVSYRQNHGKYLGPVGGSAINSLDSFAKGESARQNAAIRSLFPFLQIGDGYDRPRFPVYWHDLSLPLAGASDSDIAQGKPVSVSEEFDQPLRYLATRRRGDAIRDVADAMYRYFSIPFGGLSLLEMDRRLRTIPSDAGGAVPFDPFPRYYSRQQAPPLMIRDNILKSTAPQYLDPYYKAMQRRWSRMFPGSDYNLDMTFDENFRQLKGQGNVQDNQPR